jgi:predicted DNA-binding transcriptional regulator YafY
MHVNITDCCGDVLQIHAATGSLDLNGDRDVSSFQFQEAQTDGVRALRSACNEFLGDAAEHPQSVKLDGVPLASQISFNEGLLRLAAVHSKTVTFRYAKGDGAVIETRTLQPTEVKEVAGHVTFTGYDPDRDEPRAYRVDRMKGEVSVA